MMNYIDKYKNIIINRRGNEIDSNMTTLDIISEVKPNKFYKIKSNELLELKDNVDCMNDAICIVNMGNEVKHISILNNWNNDANIDTNSSNILGKSGNLYLNSNILKIPIANINDIGFYGCELYKYNDIIKFDINYNLPITIIEIGKNYIKDYIMKIAGGIYLEYHDRPHFHMPLDDKSDGYLVIGKYNGDKIMLSAFRIPLGYGVKIPNNVIHNDCFLIGKYLVIYSKTENYSTVLLKDNYNKAVEVIIE
jgi:hypothetical protein